MLAKLVSSRRPWLRMTICSFCQLSSKRSTLKRFSALSEGRGVENVRMPLIGHCGLTVSGNLLSVSKLVDEAFVLGNGNAAAPLPPSPL